MVFGVYLNQSAAITIETLHLFAYLLSICTYTWIWIVSKSVFEGSEITLLITVTLKMGRTNKR